MPLLICIGLFGIMVLVLKCSCGYEKHQEHNDPKGKMLEILKGIHESTFKDHKVAIEEG